MRAWNYYRSDLQKGTMQLCMHVGRSASVCWKVNVRTLNKTTLQEKCCHCLWTIIYEHRHWNWRHEIWLPWYFSMIDLQVIAVHRWKHYFSRIHHESYHSRDQQCTQFSEAKLREFVTVTRHYLWPYNGQHLLWPPRKEDPLPPKVSRWRQNVRQVVLCWDFRETRSNFEAYFIGDWDEYINNISNSD